MKLAPDEIKQIREDLDLAQHEMAERMGVSRQTIGLWEAGKAEPQPSRRRLLNQLAKRAEKAKKQEATK